MRDHNATQFEPDSHKKVREALLVLAATLPGSKKMFLVPSRQSVRSGFCLGRLRDVAAIGCLPRHPRTKIMLQYDGYSVLPSELTEAFVSNNACGSYAVL